MKIKQFTKQIRQLTELVHIGYPVHYLSAECVAKIIMIEYPKFEQKSLIKSIRQAQIKLENKQLLFCKKILDEEENLQLIYNPTGELLSKWE